MKRKIYRKPEMEMVEMDATLLQSVSPTLQMQSGSGKQIDDEEFVW